MVNAAAPPPPIAVDATATPDRLLAAAGEIFAERGFNGATVREICQRAEANIAAVNYHFGDKRGLYESVFRYAHSCVAPALAPKPGERLDPRAQLRAYIGTLLARLLDEGRPAWHAKLMAREMIEPTGVLDDLVERSVRPHFEALQALIRTLLGAGPSTETVRRCAASIIGQCVFYRHSRPILARLDPSQKYGSAEVARLAEHIADFSLDGLGGMRPRRTQKAIRIT